MTDKKYFVRKRLLDAYPANEEGTWNIHGENDKDSFDDIIDPLLETVEGRYSDVVEYALKLTYFFTKDKGGRIVKNVPQPIKKIAKQIDIRSLIDEKTRLQNRLIEIEKDLRESDLDYE